MNHFKKTNLGRVIVGFFAVIFVAVSVLAIQPARTAHAQSVGSAVSSGFTAGLSQCAAQVGGSVLTGALGGLLGSLLNPTSVPVSDTGAQTLQAATDGCLDGIAYSIAKNVLNQLADSTLSWVQSGFTVFGQPGNRGYVGDLQSFGANVADQTFNKFAEDFNANNTDEVCAAFAPQIKNELAQNYYANNTDPTGVPPEIESFQNTETAGNCDDLLSIIAENSEGDPSEAINDFLSGDFEKGGWEAFMYTVENPGASPIGAYVAQNEQLNQRINQAKDINFRELEQSDGWLSVVQCAEGEVNPSTNRCPNGDEPLIETPGTAVNQSINDLLGSDTRRLELADEVNEIVGALGNQLLSNLAGTGGNNSQGLFDEGLADNTDPLGNLDSYASGEYQGGFRADYAASTLIAQIELEQNLLAYINGGDVFSDGDLNTTVPNPGLPTTRQLSELKARANQCLADGAFGGPGEQGGFQEQITQLASAEQSVYPPPPGQSRLAQQTAGNQGEGGPQKVNWVGNPLEWEDGKLYGAKNCREFSNAYDLSYVPESESGTWQAFVCKTEDSGDFNETSRVFEGSYEEINQSSVAGLWQGNRQLYSVPNIREVEIDWTGADFEWDYYDRFAGEFVRSVYDAVTIPTAIIANGTLSSYSIPGARPSIVKEEIEKIEQILSSGSSDNINRYGLQICNEGTINLDSFSYVVKPGDDVWSYQECIETNSVYRFQDTGETSPAFRTLPATSETYADYARRISALIGDETYDVGESGFSRFTPPGGVDGNDDLRELLNDVRTFNAADGIENFSQAQEEMDRRFGLLESRFHSDQDFQAIVNAFSTLNPNDPGSLYSNLAQTVADNNCQLPDGYTPPGGDDDTGGGDGDGDGGGDSAGQPNISRFDAFRRGSGGVITINWAAAADECTAFSSPFNSGWNDEVANNGSQIINEQNPVRLTLSCSANGRFDRETRQIRGSSGGGSGGSTPIQF